METSVGFQHMCACAYAYVPVCMHMCVYAYVHMCMCTAVKPKHLQVEDFKERTANLFVLKLLS